MIRIRYSVDLCPGLNAQAECRHGATVIYLLPGLTPAQRHAALRRLRQQGRMGIGPRLPAGELAVALLALRVRTALARAAAIVRLHPAGVGLPVLGLSGAVVVFLMSLSFHIVQPVAAGNLSLPAAAPNVLRGGTGGATPGHARPDAEPGQLPAGAASSGAPPDGQPGAGQQGTGQAPPRSPGGGQGGSPLTSTAATAPVSTSSTPAASTPAPSPQPATAPASPQPIPARSGSDQICLTIGVLRICTSL